MSELKITGNVIDVLAEQSGEGRNGTWRKQDFILETLGEYPKKIAVTQWGDDIDRWGIGKGEYVEVSIDIQIREYNGRWYTDVKAWKVNRPEGARASAADDGPPPDLTAPDDDLPFSVGAPA